MRIEFGNPSPREAATGEPVPGPSVTYVNIPDTYTFKGGADAKDLALHLAQNPDITNLPDHEAFVAVAHGTAGLWTRHSASKPSWVWSDNEDMSALLSEYYGCPVGRPDDLEDTHYTQSGAPGVGTPQADLSVVPDQDEEVTDR